MSIRSVDQNCRSEALLRQVDQKKCRSEVLKCRSEKVWIRSVDQVSLKSVAQKCQSEVLLRSVDEKGSSKVSSRSDDQCFSSVSISSVVQQCC